MNMRETTTEKIAKEQATLNNRQSSYSNSRPDRTREYTNHDQYKHISDASYNKPEKRS